MQGFYYRPRPIKLTEYTKLKHIVGQRARKLLAEGKEIKAEKEQVRFVWAVVAIGRCKSLTFFLLFRPTSPKSES